MFLVVADDSKREMRSYFARQKQNRADVDARCVTLVEMIGVLAR